MLKNFHKTKYNSGVTLIELLVVIAILGIMSTTTLVSYNNFRSSMSIQNLADDIALSVRKAQGFAIGTVHSYRGSYGIHFSIDPIFKPARSSKKSFILFANIDNPFKYDVSNEQCGKPESGNECLELLQIISSDEIYEIRYGTMRVTGGWRETKINTKESIDIFFIRPNAEPTFCFKSNQASLTCTESEIVYIKIFVRSTRDPGTYKIVTIWNNGQISVS